MKKLSRIEYTILFFSLFLLASCGPNRAIYRAEPVAQPQAYHPPQFEDSFAVSSVWPGQVWRIYIRGSDPDGDMDRIWAYLTQLGAGRVANDLVILRGSDRRSFAGYLEFFTPLRIGMPEYVRVELMIRDRAGNYSEKRVHELEIGYPTREALPARWREAAQNRLGTLFLDLELRTNGRDGVFK